MTKPHARKEPPTEPKIWAFKLLCPRNPTESLKGMETRGDVWGSFTPLERVL